MLNVGLIIPTYNGGPTWSLAAKKIYEQRDFYHRCLVIDSGSVDETVRVSTEFGFELVQIDKREFDHAGTRNMAAQYLSDCDIFVFMTQDAILCDHAIEEIVQQFENVDIAAVCGRQIPHDNANILASHARLFNYPDKSTVKSLKDVPSLGIKTAFMSNSFSAYRRSVFFDVGMFPRKCILSEDMYISAKIILAGYSVAYCSTAIVKHSHNYSVIEEFRRYFDIGVFHACEPWIQNDFGHASGEGLRFIKSEFSYLFKNAPLWIPKAVISTIFKFAGYKIGCHYKYIPPHLRAHFSMCKNYWPQ